jgi:hypothetical protein
MAIIKPGQLSSGPYNISGSFSGSFTGDGSNLINVPTQSFNTGSFVTTSSFNSFTGSYNTGSFTGSFTGSLLGVALTASYTVQALSSSFATTAQTANTASYVLNAVSASFASTASFVRTSQTASYVLNAVSASYANVANSINTLNQSVLISGSLTVLGGGTFYGSSSFVYLTASQLDISASFISVNVFEPVERFGGLIVYDSGSSLATSSLAWDSLHNHWVYQNVSGASYTGGMLLSGPRNTGSLGDEPNLTKWFIPRSDGGDHLDDSQIFSSGSIHIATGSLTVTQGVTASLLGTASYATQALSASFAPSTPAFPFTGSALITGSLGVTGSLSTRAQGSTASDIAFRVRNSADNKNIMEVRGDSETRWTGLTAVGNYVAIKNWTSYDANIDLMAGNNVLSRIYSDVDTATGNGNLNRGLNIWTPGIVGSATAKINNVVKSGLQAYGEGYGFNWAFTSNASGSFTQAERAMWLTWQKSLVFYTGSSSPIDTFSEKGGAFEIYASSSNVTNGIAAHFNTNSGTTIWLGNQSKLFNVTASSITSSFTGSLQGTSSYAVTASYALNTPPNLGNIIGITQIYYPFSGF